jgi:hypothetical protein
LAEPRRIGDAAEVREHGGVRRVVDREVDLYLAAVQSAADELRRVTQPTTPMRAAQELRWSLEAHVTWIESNSLAYRTVVQGGMSGDSGIRQIVEQSRQEVVDRIALSMRRSRADPWLRIAMRGWIGFLEGACLDWLDARDLDRADLVRLLEASLGAVLATANVREDRPAAGSR